jgi:hypothetical protein
LNPDPKLTPPPQQKEGGTHSLRLRGVGGPNSDEGTDTVVYLVPIGLCVHQLCKNCREKKSESNFRQNPDSKLFFLIRNTEIKYKKWLTLQFIINDGMGLLSPLSSNIRDIFIK